MKVKESALKFNLVSIHMQEALAVARNYDCACGSFNLQLMTISVN